MGEKVAVDRFAVFVIRVGAVGARAGEVLVVEVQAVGGFADQAVLAPAAREVAEAHGVPGSYLRYALADPLDDPRTLVAQDRRQRHRIPLVAHDQIRVAHPRADYPDEDLANARPV